MGFNSINKEKDNNFSKNSDNKSNSDYNNFDNDNYNNKDDENIIPELLFNDPLDNKDKNFSNHNLNNSNLNNSNLNNSNFNNSNSGDFKGDNSFNSNLNNSNSNDYKDKNFSNPDLNDNDFNLDSIVDDETTELINRPVDVRIIVEAPEKSEFLSKAIKNIDLDDFNIIISSIITTTDIQIAKNATSGSNIILVAVDLDEEGEKRFSIFYDALKTDFNYVEFLKFPKIRDIEITDIKNVENEVKNSIIRSGLASIFDISNINQVKYEISNLKEVMDQSIATNEKITLENDMLIDESKNLRKTNEKLNEDIIKLQNYIDDIKHDFTDYQSRYSNIHSKNLLEIFLIKELWFEIFAESLTDEEVDKIVIATNKFRPENLIVGQDYIGATSKEDGMDWLKIVKTAIIFIENNNDELQEEMINYYKKKQKFDNNFLENPHNNLNNPNNIYDNHNNDSNHEHNNYKDKNNDINIENNIKKSNNKYNEEEDDYDYDIMNQFQNFWD